MSMHRFAVTIRPALGGICHCQKHDNADADDADDDDDYYGAAHIKCAI